MNSKFFKTILLGMLLILCMSVTMATEVSEDTVNEVAIQSVNIDQTTLNTVDSDNSDQVTHTKKYTTKSNNTINLTEKSKNDNEITSSVNEKIITKNKKNNIKKEAQTITLNSNNFDEYITDGKFNENVTEGDTIDIQGKLDNPRYALNINKPLNIISSSGDAYIDLDTHSTDTSGSYTNGIFQLTEGSAGTNITGITFHNTRINISNTENVHIDNITAICESNIGFGVGSFTIRDNSNNITVANSFFKTFANGGHSNVVITGSQNCFIENNTIEGDGSEGIIGNLLYITTYGGGSSTNITIRNNTIRSFYTYGYGTCYGLALSGKGHIIENNYIDTSIPLKNQYAEAEYGVVTEVDSITFKNNIITYSDYNAVEGAHTPAEISFPGIVTNNTFYTKTTINQATVYNNTFKDTVTINNNVKFENNTANQVSVTGNNNTLNNNEIYSDEEYAVKITGENNTLTNNKLLSNNGYGEDAISNSTEFTSEGNNEEVKMPRVFYINDSNVEEYFTYDDWFEEYMFKADVFKDGDILVFNLSDKEYEISSLDEDWNDWSVDLVIENSTFLSTFNFGVSGVFLTVKNSIIPYEVGPTGKGPGIRNYLLLINSTVQSISRYVNSEDFTNIDSIVMNEYPKDNTYILFTSVKINQVFDNNGNLLNTVNSSSNILIYTSNLNDMYINKALNLTDMSDISLTSNVYLLAGSEETNFNSITFDGDVIFETGNIAFYNCTFNKDLIVNQSYIIFDGCTFNGKVTLNSTSNNIFNNNIFNSANSINIVNSRINTFENNTVNTTAEYTIIFDDDSNNNNVRYNTLIASSSFGDYSVTGGDNIVEDNNPAYSTQISIGCESQYFADDTPVITVTVNDIDNNMLVTSGYVEVYYDGYFIDKKDLVNGQTTVTLPSYVIGNYPIKVWYYDGIKYNDNVTKVNVDVVKSNVTITVDEFTAKLNEKATVAATFLNQNGNPVSDTNVTFTVGRSSYTVETVDGIATLDEMVTKEWLDSGKITVSFPSTDAYNTNSTTITLNTSKADVLVTPMVSVDGNVADVELTLSDNLGVNVTDGRIVLSTLDGQELASGRVSNGKFISNVALPEGYSDEYLVANFTGSYYYNDFVRNVKITQMLNSTVTLETNSPLYGEELVITGKLVDSKNTPIGGANLTLNLNGSKVIVTTNNDGEYTYTYTPCLGVNSLTVTFDGTVDVYGSSASKDVTIRDTDREMNEVLNRLDDLQKENDKLREQLEQLQEQNNKTSEQLDNITQANNELKEQLANQTANLTEQNKNLQGQLDNLTKDNEDLSEQLNDTKNNLTQQNKDLQEQNKELNDKLDSTAKNLTDANKALQEQNKALQDQNKQLNDKLDAILKQLEDNMAKDAVITVNSIPGAKFGQNVTISGKLSDCDGNVIASSPVSVSVGGIAQKVTTDKDGVYNLTVRASVVGDNSVVVSFDADNNYNYAENTTTFKVARQNLVLKLDSIKSVYYGDKVKITGVLSDANGKLIANTLLNLNINGKTVKVKTVAGGKFTYTVAAKTVGTNNVTVSYNGNKNYNGVSAKKTFKVYKQGLKITVNKITSTKYKNTVKVTGKLTDANGKVIMNTLVNININGKAYTAKTNNKGVYTLTLKATSIGVNNVSVSYKGNKNYKKATAKTSFKVAKQNVKVTLTGSSYSNAKATITGKLVDANNKVLMNSNVKITINNKTYTAKTNTEGTYTITKPVTTKKISLTLAYNGNKNYNAYKKTSNVTLA
ncbi:Ig-like domain repeat protein [Methanosphaera sp. ISO3-F5]|uniref:Ig-like domain repeat protein n=1 Tax=Methanosphaera sp. ISO3-F5 TaxID=1452353 RepID=UPI002B263AEE|nr:Ig-like domain repeat protein [Methanosphaera sp. ISO3-F5]WQH64776.1 hypothetical protein PXD04_03000 [Methanosphaera sp. ISO3-F5]